MHKDSDGSRRSPVSTGITWSPARYSTERPHSPSCIYKATLTRRHDSELKCRALLQGKEIQRLNNIYKNILKNNGVEHVEGRAYMKDAHTVQVFGPDGQVIREMTAANILVAVGGQPHRLGVPGTEHTITSDEALSLPEQPKRIAIIGAGYIAVEFAGIFAGFGTEVHLFYRKDLPLTSAPLSSTHTLLFPQPMPCFASRTCLRASTPFLARVSTPLSPLSPL